jgi:hypothetical protein
MDAFLKARLSFRRVRLSLRPVRTTLLSSGTYFACGLRLPSVKFLHEVLEEFDVQIHHLTPNGFLTLSKFC